jgi:hypothetical protein
VNVNADGLGEVLIYPYYTTRTVDGNTFNTYISVTNTTADYKALKVRFLEGKNSKECLDFNIYMSPDDVWTAAIEPIDATDLSLGAQMVTADNTCMVPSAKTKPFVNYAFTGAAADGESTSLERCTEGYVEIIEMGIIPVTTLVGAGPATVQAGLKHGAGGVPANCGALGTLEVNVATAGDVITQTGGLMGSSTLINIDNGIAYGVDPTVLDNWSTAVNGTWFDSGSILPTLANVNPKSSDVYLGGAVVITDTWANIVDNAADPVTAVLMVDNVLNEFMMDAITNSGTDWVVTFPTKSFYVVNDTLVAGVRQHVAAEEPFQENFWTGGSCDEVAYTVYDREEAVVIVTNVSQPSPPPPVPVTTPDTLCWEANVISFVDTYGATSNNLGSANAVSLTSGYENGWMNINFPLVVAYPLAHILDNITSGNTYLGLPAIGFAVQDYQRGDLANGVRANLGAAFEHKVTRNIF